MRKVLVIYVFSQLVGVYGEKKFKWQNVSKRVVKFQKGRQIKSNEGKLKDGCKSNEGKTGKPDEKTLSKLTDLFQGKALHCII